MSLANLISLVSSAHIDPTTAPEIDDSPEVTETVLGFNGHGMPIRKGKLRSDDKGDGSQAAPIHNGPKPQGMEMPELKINAPDFIKAMRNAGIIIAEGKRVFDKSKERSDKIAAIHSYLGYDNRRDFGSQEQEAMRHAQRAMRGNPAITGPTREEQRAATKSLAGYVHGMPAPQQRLVLDLQARRVSAAEARDKATTDAERAQHQTMLDAANNALAELGL